MPAQHPRVAFEPIPPELNIADLVESTPNFEFAARISCHSIDAQGLDAFERLVWLHVVHGGKPLVVEGFTERLDPQVFSEKWLRRNYSHKVEVARNLTAKSNLPLTIGHYLKNMPVLGNGWDASNYESSDRQRIYLKDIDCPKEWHDHLKQLIPQPLFYLDEGFGSASVPSSCKKGTDSRAELLTARPGDLMSSLPPDMRAENLMCYIGHEGTYTPSHQEMCGSLGHNIMIEASDGSVEGGKRTSPGSSIWFMTETRDRQAVSGYWASILGHHIDMEDHFAEISAWKAAPFKTYIVEQKPGDFILIPPLAAHQVWNRGTRTMKVAWNRTTVDTLELALNEVLPRARVVCRDEQYKNKAIVFYSLEKYSKILDQLSKASSDHANVRKLQKDFQQLFSLYTGVLLSESFSPKMPEEKDIEYIPYDGNITCSYCRCCIFNRFLTCPWCIEGEGTDEENTYDICMECYAMGRSCACVSRLKWAEQFRWGELTKKHEKWRKQILQQCGQTSNNYQSLDIERDALGKRTLAEICQAQLNVRPWVDITKLDAGKTGTDPVEPGDLAQARKRRKIRHSTEAKSSCRRCHGCSRLFPPWRLASCFYCNRSYCFGSLYRMFNITPQSVMEQFRWKCPKCQNFCNCCKCRQDLSMQHFKPVCSLGHDTMKIADPRSIQTLVDYSQSNIRFLRKVTGIDTSQSLRLPQQEAKANKGRGVKDRRPQPVHKHRAEPEEISPCPIDTSGYSYQDGYESIPIDPALEYMENSGLAASPETTNQMGLQDIARYTLR